MRARGINYDTGLFPRDHFTRPTLTPAIVRAELAVIAGELHCDAVRVSGIDAERIGTGATIAAEAGLEVWVAPFPADLSPTQVLAFLADCAQRAETVRQNGAEVVFVAGCEMSVFCESFIPGDTYLERIQALISPDTDWRSDEAMQERLNDFLAQAAATVRAHFGGRITYASGAWESVDWQLFDIVSIDAYPTGDREEFRAHLREFAALGKPLAIAEFGTCAYRGAGELGGMAWRPPEDAVPDESEQVRYFTELMDIFEEEGVDTALWFSFANYDKAGERDIASYGAVRVLDETRWEPKEVFHAIAARYAHPS